MFVFADIIGKRNNTFTIKAFDMNNELLLSERVIKIEKYTLDNKKYTSKVISRIEVHPTYPYEWTVKSLQLCYFKVSQGQLIFIAIFGSIGFLLVFGGLLINTKTRHFMMTLCTQLRKKIK